MGTRLGFVRISERLSREHGRTGTKFNLDRLESIYFDNRSFAAEFIANELVALCRATPSATATSGKTVEPDTGCAALANWGRKLKLTTVGVSVFREFCGAARLIPSLLSMPFSATDPPNIPRGLNTANPSVYAALLKALADSVEKLVANRVALETPLGSL
jgi:acyl-homoserine-lactone acylase